MAKVLIVDDSETLRMQLRKALETENHTVVEGVDGFHALEVLRTNQDLNLMITDLNMPNMDGLTLCEKVHAMPDLSHVPIFMLTTESSVEMMDRGKAVGVIAWITKPFVKEKLLVAIGKILDKNK